MPIGAFSIATAVAQDHHGHITASSPRAARPGATRLRAIGGTAKPHTDNSNVFLRTDRPLDATPETLRTQLESFTTTLKHKLAYQEKSMRRVDRYLSTRFNVFDLITPGENLLSDILRDLLDPQGPHGQGDTFLREFLNLRPSKLARRVKVPAIAELVGIAPDDSISSARLTREGRTLRIPAEFRRMDLHIEIDGRAIAIENKTRAADQPNQLHAYAEQMDNDRALTDHRSNWLLIYLTPHGYEPSEASITPAEAKRLRQEGHLIELSYLPDIRDWLDRCSRACESDKYRWFLRDFRDHISSTLDATAKENSNARGI